MGLTLASRREMIQIARARYALADKTQKGKVIDEFSTAEGYSPKYAVLPLRKSPALDQLWERCRLCTSLSQPRMRLIRETHHVFSATSRRGVDEAKTPYQPPHPAEYVLA